jgi:predicted nucleic acid-binding protein
MNLLNTASWNELSRQADEIRDSWLVIQPTETLRRKAIDAVEAYDLRAADALQLAAALEWCGDATQGQVFLTLDQKLRDAALLCGFDVGRI